MRKLIVTNIVSLDGYYEGPGGDVMVMPMYPSFDAHNVERMQNADTLLLGRNSYLGFKGFWPGQALDPAASDDHREIARLMHTTEKVVVSDTLTLDETDPWRDTTRIVSRSEADAQIAELKRAPGRDVLVIASRTLWNHLLAVGLVDELHLIIGAVVVGGGTPAFSAPLPGPLQRLGTRTFDDCGNVLVQYAT